MKQCFKIVFFFVFLSVSAKNIKVSSQVELDKALKDVIKNDTIVWLPGTYSDVFLNITKSDIVIKAQVLGEVIFTGESRMQVEGDNVIIEGFQFLNGNIGKENVIETSGSDNIFRQINIAGYISWKYLVIKEASQRIVVSYSNFENRLNLDDKNILSILVNENQLGLHKIQYCSFKNFKGKGGDMGIEPIRIGLSTQREFSSKSVVEYCYFAQCNGDGEIISNKSGGNVFRYNTFNDNPVSELVLRHGDSAVVYGNFFLNGKGGVRIKEGSNHAVYNNYFSGLTQRSILLQNTKNDPVSDVIIAHNTFVKTAEVRLGGATLEYQPKKITVVNNLLVKPLTCSLSELTGKEYWAGNIYFKSLGVEDREGLKQGNPTVKKNNKGFYQLARSSSAINASEIVEAILLMSATPEQSTDSTLSYDIMGKMRPKNRKEKDVGCWEFHKKEKVCPLVNVQNTGPSYLEHF